MLSIQPNFTSAVFSKLGNNNSPKVNLTEKADSVSFSGRYRPLSEEQQETLRKLKEASEKAFDIPETITHKDLKITRQSNLESFFFIKSKNPIEHEGNSYKVEFMNPTYNYKYNSYIRVSNNESGYEFHLSNNGSKKTLDGISELSMDKDKITGGSGVMDQSKRDQLLPLFEKALNSLKNDLK
jgi:hypothetical protein